MATAPELPKVSFKNWFSPLTVIAVALVGLTAYWLFIGRGNFGVPKEWGLEPNATAWPAGSWLLPLGVLVIFGGAAGLSAYDRFKRAKSDRERRASTRLCIVALMLLSFLWQWALLGPGALAPAAKPGQPIKLTMEGRLNIILAMWSDVATEYFGAAYQVTDARDFARNYARDSQKPVSVVISHVATHPPGAVLFFYGVRRLVETVPGLTAGSTALACTLTNLPLADLLSAANTMRASAAMMGNAPVPPALPPGAIGTALCCAILLSLIAVSIIPAVFWIATAGAEDAVRGDTRGLVAGGLFAFAPTLNLYSFTLDALVAAGVAWSLFCLSRRLGQGNAGWSLASGCLLALTTFVSIGALAAIAICVGAILLSPQRRNLREVFLWLGGLLGGWLLIWLALPFDVLSTYHNAMAAHHLATTVGRTWSKWAVMNLVMWAVFCGWPLALGLLAALAQFARRQVEPASGPRQSPGEMIGVAAVVAMLLLTASGNVRGEVERLWLFLLAPLAVLAASRVSWRVTVPLILFQALQTLMMAATLAPLVRPI